MNYRRHRGACCFYRENWFPEGETNGAGEEVLYQIICLQGTPPVTEEEQQQCLHSPTRCWRLEFAARRNGRNGREKAHCRTGEKDGAAEAAEAAETP